MLLIDSSKKNKRERKKLKDRKERKQNDSVFSGRAPAFRL